MNMSLQARLLVAGLMIISLFLGSTGYVLHRAFESSLETALKERLQGHVYALLSVATTQYQHLILPNELPVAGLGLTDSGLYAAVSDQNKEIIWQSRSMLGQQLSFETHPQQGQWHYTHINTGSANELLLAAFTVAWEDAGQTTPYTFYVAENLQRHRATLANFRQQLWWGLGGAATLLLVAQIMILRWGLLPLKQVEHELDAIESGQQTRLLNQYPRELSSLTINLNRLLENAETRLRRYRESLGNLAHSLKTPVSILRGQLENSRQDSERDQTSLEQLARITQTVDYHLQRAGTAGHNVLTRPVELKPLIEKTVRALQKVYADRHVRIDMSLEPGLYFHGDEGDLMEVIGNITDNAFKWCHSRVAITTRARPLQNEQIPIEVCIEDDGPGIDASIIHYVTERGRRADTSVPGQGIGLAMVNEIVRLYGGELQIETIDPHGTRIRVIL